MNFKQVGSLVPPAVLNLKHKFNNREKFIDWGPNCSPEKYLEIIGLRLASLRGKDFSAAMNFYCKKLRFYGLKSKQPCIYYIEKTPREKIREFERRLVQFCRPEVYKKLKSSEGPSRPVKWSCDYVKSTRFW